MKNTLLIFSDTSSISEFILNCSISKAEVNSMEQTLIAPLTDDEILIACNDYNAHLNTDHHILDRIRKSKKMIN